MIHELYPGRWRHLLLRLCGPSCGCPSPGKSPHVEGAAWQKHALERFERCDTGEAATRLCNVEAHFTRGGNVGLAIPPFVAALDVDTDWTSKRAILSLCDENPTQKTGNPIGVHVWGHLTDRRAYGTHYGIIPVTIRGVGNQVVVAPSIHANGREYEWLRELPPDPELLPPLHSALFHHISGTSKINLKRRVNENGGDWRARVSEAWLAELEDPEVIFPVSRRHDALLWLAWHLTVCGADPDEVKEALRDLANTRCAGEGRFARGKREARFLNQEMDNLVRDSRRYYEAQIEGVP